MESKSIREKIIDVASDFFYKKGYNKTKISEITKEAGITKETLCKYFKTKEDICISYLRFRNEKFSKEVLSYVEQADEGKSKILAIFNYLELFYQMENFDGCWAIKIFSEVSFDQEHIRNEIALQKRGMIGFIEFLIQENINIDKDSKVLARNIYLLLETAVVQSNVLKEEWPITNAKAMCEKLLN
ncbi:TetR/AcrR family transcriptional regulator [Aquimarina sp. 2201CG5-10]|uniref:TetR/AcrR family transcriptional regulator n=1 Tax=Aquimarina callyspongiae TaxID=3098150 RepID=UPI002AB361DA|nr:TetR/AcrR family transcriptional regulator [Aquimarina sp. 2201CG5-10]MDY8135518.1 TetR/AcrR family transcriptional regulator [Aquimarina sp. 2201CG5-10]